VSIDKVTDKDPKDTSKEQNGNEETKEEAHKRKEAEALRMIGEKCVTM
jgi:2,3-bisphosphoglycerate-independent phosphoglycerate mutase